MGNLDSALVCAAAPKTPPHSAPIKRRILTLNFGAAETLHQSQKRSAATYRPIREPKHGDDCDLNEINNGMLNVGPSKNNQGEEQELAKLFDQRRQPTTPCRTRPEAPTPDSDGNRTSSRPLSIQLDDWE